MPYLDDSTNTQRDREAFIECPGSPGNLIYTLPIEIVQHVLGYLSPLDFEAARLTCWTWLAASLYPKLLKTQLQRGEWWSTITNEDSIQQSKRLSFECSLIPGWKTEQSPLIQTAITDFTALDGGIEASKGSKLRLTASACGRFLLVARSKTIFVYALQKGNMWPVCSVVCPGQVLAMSMDASSQKYTVAALLEGRLGCVADLISGIVDPQKFELKKSAFPISTAPRSFYRRLGTEYDPPRSVAICPSHRGVAFGSAGNIDLHWVDDTTGQETSRRIPINTPADSLFFLPPRKAIDPANKMRLISSAVPMSDGQHALFIDPTTNLLCIGTTTLSKVAMFIPPTDLASKFLAPNVHAAAPDTKHGVRIAAAYGTEIVLFSVPADAFAQSQTQPESFPIVLPGIKVGSLQSDVVAVAAEARRDDVVVWAFDKDGKAATWRRGGGGETSFQNRVVRNDGTVDS